MAFPKACIFSRMQSSSSQKWMCWPDNRITPHLKLFWNCKMKSTFCKQPSAVTIIAFTDSCISCFPQQNDCYYSLCHWTFCSSHQSLCSQHLICSMEVLSPPSFLFRRCFVSVCIPTLKFILLLFPIITNFLFHWWRGSVWHNMELIHFENKLLACSFLFLLRSLVEFFMHSGLN